MIKRIISFAITTALTVSLFAGCGSTNNESTASSSAATETTAATAAASSTEAQKEVTLTLWEQAANKQQILTDIQNDFMKDNPNIKLNIVEQADMSQAALLSAVAAGNAPSVFMSGYSTMSGYILNNAVQPIDDYIAKTPDFANFDKTQVDTFLVNGKHYAVPKDKYVMGFFYNKKLFAEAGITATPTTWDELYDAAKKLTNPAKQQYGFGLDGTQWASWHFMNWVWAAGGDLTKMNDDGTVALTLTDPAVITAADFYKKLKADKVIQPNANADITTLEKDFALGKSGFIVSGLQAWKILDLVSKGAKAEDIGYFNFPVGPSGKAYAQMGGDVAFIVTTKDQDIADASWKYLMYVNSKDSVVRQIKDSAAKGPLGADIMPRTDVKVSDYGTIDADLQKAMDAGNLIGRNEYYAKGAIGAGVDDAIAKWFADPKLDVAKTMQSAQDALNSKEAAEFNKAATGK